MKPFNPEKAQFYYDTASSFQDALVKSSNQLLEYEDKIRTLKNENDELKKQVDSLVSNLAAAHEDRNEEAKSVFLAKQVEIPELLRENAALRTAAVEVCALARVWVTVWGDKLSPDTVKRFAELEKQILKNTQP